MKNKGITLITMVVVVAIIAIILSIVTIIGSGNIDRAKFETFKQNIDIVQEAVEMRYEKDNILPVIEPTQDVLSSLSTNNKNAILAELSQKGDNKANLKIVDMNRIYNILKNVGKGTIADKNIFLIDTESHNIYYLKGHTYKGNIYFGQVNNE